MDNVNIFVEDLSRLKTAGLGVSADSLIICCTESSFMSIIVSILCK